MDRIGVMADIPDKSNSLAFQVANESIMKLFPKLHFIYTVMR
jgi:hypothetical protein